MEKICHSIEELVGNTPLLELCRIEKEFKLEAKILAKLEYFNPAGSVKDRVAVAMIDDAEKRGLLTKNSVIIEPTSGNTGIGLACIAAVRGYKAIIVMPDTMSAERRQLIAAFGAEIVLSEGSKGMRGAIEKAEELSRRYAKSFIPAQFDNPANADEHRLSTGTEIWESTAGAVDIFVAGVGTGGTITGTGEYLKSMKRCIKVVAVEPAASAVLSGGMSGSHGIQGIGAGFVPSVLNPNIFDEVMQVSDDDAFLYTRLAAEKEGVFAGISSGAALAAAITLARRKENNGKTIVALFPDSGNRYLSTPVFALHNG